MSKDADIYDAFCTRVSAFAAAQVPALTVSFPGVAFEPPTAGRWLEVRWFPNETINYGIADEGPSLHQGFGQVAVCQRPGPIVDSLAIAGDVVDYFAKGTPLGPVRVESRPYVSAVLTEDDRLMHPITIRYRGLLYT